MGKWEWGFCRFHLLFVTERLQLVLSSDSAGMRCVEAGLGGSNLWLHCRCRGLQTACLCGCQRGETGQWWCVALWPLPWTKRNLDWASRSKTEPIPKSLQGTRIWGVSAGLSFLRPILSPMRERHLAPQPDGISRVAFGKPVPWRHLNWDW